MAHSVWSASAIFAPGNLKLAEEALRDEIARALADGFTEAELRDATAGLLNFRRLSRAQDGALANRLATLTPREREILQFLSEGYLYKEISDRLSISYSTVRTHIERIYEKLHVQSRAQAVAKAGGVLSMKP